MTGHAFGLFSGDRDLVSDQVTWPRANLVSDQGARRSELDRFLRDAAEYPYDSRIVDGLEACRFFDPRSVRWYRSVFSDRNPGRQPAVTDVEFLRERGFVVECADGLAPTRAAVLIFGRPRYVREILRRPVTVCEFIEASFHEWSADRHWVDRVVVEENLLQAWLILADRYLRYAERPFRLDPRTMRRDDLPVDYVSFREAVINQLVHQDYGDHSRTAFIRFYRDRTVFWNPGDALASSTDELLDPTANEVRNPAIIGAFRRISLSEQAGVGMWAIFRNWRGLGHAAPVIKNEKARRAFELVLVRGERRNAAATERRSSRAEVRADKGSDHGDQVGPDMGTDQVPLRLTTRQRAIVDACDVPRSLVELMERANVSHRSHFRTRHLKPLLQIGVVRMTNPRNPRASNQKYVLTEAGVGLKARWIAP